MGSSHRLWRRISRAGILESHDIPVTTPSTQPILSSLIFPTRKIIQVFRVFIPFFFRLVDALCQKPPSVHLGIHRTKPGRSSVPTVGPPLYVITTHSRWGGIGFSLAYTSLVARPEAHPDACFRAANQTSVPKDARRRARKRKKCTGAWQVPRA